MIKVMALKSDFSFYLGSSTTPPCEGKLIFSFLDHVLHLLSNTPILMANCQFKTLRENTLKSDKLKETHARQIKINAYGGPSGEKNIKFLQMKPLANLNQLVPERQIQKIIEASKSDASDGSNAPQGKKKTESQIANKEKIKDATKELFKTKVSCDLERTYNPPNPPKQPSITK